MKCHLVSDSSVNRRGFSIVELMIAITISLIVLVVMMKAFQRASGEIKKGRAMIEMASEMRAVGETFRRDLAHLTVSPRVWNLNSECDGYFEVVEGAQNDATYPADPVTYPGMSFFGDIDDIVAMTVRSGEKPFRGRWDDDGNPATAPQIVESHVAEVIWFTVHEDVDEANGNVDMDDRVTLYRRVLLVRPDLAITETAANITAYFQNNDISARAVGANIVANSLSDLTLRENRYAHDPIPFDFPYEMQRASLLGRLVSTGEDIMLTNVAGFDIRVYSPNSPVKVPNGAQFLGPSDPNYGANASAPADEGGYVDLGWGGTGWFGAVPSQFAPPESATWCSWSPHYFYNSNATNGLDDNGNGLVDEEAEMTSINVQAPYPWPIRGLQLTMRGIEKSTRNIRQVTITSSFVPE